MLLSMTLLFSALMAGVSMAVNAPPMTNLITFGISIVLLWFVLPKVANSGAGIAVVFAITGLLGFGLFTAMIFYGFKRCVKKLRKTTEENRWVYYACLFSVSAFLITGIFESNLYYSNLAVFFWILFSVMLFSPLEPESA